MYQETQHFYQLWRLAVQERDEAREQLIHSLAELTQLRELLNTILLSEGKVPSYYYYLEAADESTVHQYSSYNLFPRDSSSHLSVNSSQLDLRSDQMRFVVENMIDYETVVLEMIGGVLPENGKFLQAVSEAGSWVESLFIAGTVPKWINPPVQLSSQWPVITGNGNWNYGGLVF